MAGGGARQRETITVQLHTAAASPQQAALAAGSQGQSQPSPAPSHLHIIRGQPDQLVAGGIRPRGLRHLLPVQADVRGGRQQQQALHQVRAPQRGVQRQPRAQRGPHQHLPLAADGIQQLQHIFQPAGQQRDGVGWGGGAGK